MHENLTSCGNGNQYTESSNSFNDSQNITDTENDSREEREPESAQISSNHFFEGAEKLLEIWFTDNGSAPNATLRTISRYALDKYFEYECKVLKFNLQLIFNFVQFSKTFDDVLFKIGISIMSVRNNKAMDAYVLRCVRADILAFKKIRVYCNKVL